MSSFGLFILNRKSARLLNEFEGSHLYAPVLLDFLKKKYYPEVDSREFALDRYENAWKLFCEEKFNCRERAALNFIKDGSFIALEDLGKFGVEFVELGKEILDDMGMGVGWINVGHELAGLHYKRFHHNARGVAAAITSCAYYWLEGDAKRWIDNAWRIKI